MPPPRYRRYVLPRPSPSACGRTAGWAALRVPSGESTVCVCDLLIFLHAPPAVSQVRPAAAEPECLWEDRGLGGAAGSVWRINSMSLVVATKGLVRPAGPFYELIEQPFTLAEVSVGLYTRGREREGEREGEREMSACVYRYRYI